jgi:hypothetical protein
MQRKYHSTLLKQTTLNLKSLEFEGMNFSMEDVCRQIMANVGLFGTQS